mmetsp:Transcript_5623/g.8080  ORF Transcript_5623/g.8080 Transcript_5623/m.8080 type:complete len:420 (+) Transcript_5623:49-1308(+)|eukprot:CAMPEP_0195511632 /NCGR_PEP_ID=MMETSP0794_2-20130614/3886_1 /TAXON_ID=515487 /ORGANISM="Stephanopyxis turris, Strain CCMP 815" /LENGTH=419 /DNA_ID=CAMNT_0040639277 /DNA_START=42 /DNA_END=1301 /DNA_ORIENTATION=-
MRAPFRFSCCSILRVASILNLLTFGSIASSSYSSNDDKKTDALSQARLLIPPIANASLNGEFESFEFWDNHGDLLREAWSILYRNHRDALPPLLLRSPSSSTPFSNNILHPPLQRAVEAARKTPTIETETNVKSLWTEVIPNNNKNDDGGAYKCQLFTAEGVATIRAYIDLVSNSGIPTRRPNGMNRFGFIFDEFDKHEEERINGAVSLPPLSAFYSNLVQEYIRPMGRMFFPRYIQKQQQQQQQQQHHDSIRNEEEDNNDGESFGFTIRYSQDEDVRLNEHSDASLYTLNVNLNLSGEGYTNSSIYFVNEDDGERITTMEFDTPGMAVLHKGSIRHGANAIVDGSRINLVVWLFGKDGYVRVAPYQDESDCMTLEERWSSTSTTSTTSTSATSTSSSKRNRQSIEKEHMSLVPPSWEL